MVDVAVVGAGLAGLVCARQLQQEGYRVVIVEKSRGLGGRLATRRLQNTWADHGARAIALQGPSTTQLIQTLTQQGILQPWTDQHYEYLGDGHLHRTPLTDPLYVAPTGITAVAKELGKGLEIWRSQRVQSLAIASEGWQLTLEPAGVEPQPPVHACAVVLAIPAPQAAVLVESLAPQDVGNELLPALRSVVFDPCISAIALYPSERQAEITDLPWKSLSFVDHPQLTWVGVDSSKRSPSQQPLLVLQSTAQFAERYLDASTVQPAGEELLAEAAKVLLPWFNTPDVLQVHRWRYAFVRNPVPSTHLGVPMPFPIICCGDWCGGQTIESALASGSAAANQMSQYLKSER